MKEYQLKINSNSYTVVIKDVTEDTVLAEVNGTEHVVRIDTIENLTHTEIQQSNQVPASSPKTPLPRPSASSTPPAAGSGNILTPIPGQVLSITVSIGEKVQKGQKLLVLEAMKLENSITATMTGTVSEILVKEGDVVNQGQSLIVLI